MRKLKEFDDNIRTIDEEMTALIADLRKMDRKSEEYARGCKALRDLQGAAYTGVRARGDYKERLVPNWAVQGAGMLTGTAIWAAIMKKEADGGVISSQSVNVWDKVVRKFTRG